MGIKIAKKEQKLGIRASSTCTLDFDDLRLPEDSIIGGEGKGYKVSDSHAKHLINDLKFRRLLSRSLMKVG